MPAFILVLAVFSSALAMVISVDSLFFIILPIMEHSSPWVNHLLFWPSLIISIVIGREVFWWVIRFLCVEETHIVKEVTKWRRKGKRSFI